MPKRGVSGKSPCAANCNVGRQHTRRGVAGLADGTKSPLSQCRLEALADCRNKDRPLDQIPLSRPADADLRPADPAIADSMIRSSRQSDDTMWLRIPVSVVVSGFLFVFMGPAAGLGWLAAVLAAEGISFLVLARLIRSGGTWRRVNLISVWAISACWIVFSIMLWSTGHEIARIATVVTLLTGAIHGVTSAYMNRSLLLALIGPQLVTLGIILIAYAWSTQEPAAAVVTTAATLGACAIVALNGITLNHTDSQLVQSNADLVALNARILELAQQAETRSEARTVLLANVSHDLRAPLNGVIASAQQLAQAPLTAAQKRLLQMLMSSAETLDRLAGDLLDLSAMEAGQSSLKPSPVDLGQLVESIAEQMRSTVEAKGLALKVETRAMPDTPVLLDPVRLQQVLGNLLANAIKFTEHGAISVSVRPSVSGGAADMRAMIVVEDTGRGLGAADTEALFERFRRGDGGGLAPPGLGLGLTIARTLTEAMGGRLRAEHREVGSAFIIDLPLVPAEASMAPGDMAQADAAARQHAAKDLRILVADDNDANRHLLSLILESFGASVETVSDGAAAVTAFSIEPFDVVLLDMIMPGKDGLSAARDMRMVEESGRSARTPILMLTAMHSEDLKTACIAAGCDELLTKPIFPAKLAEAISRHVATPGG